MANIKQQKKRIGIAARQRLENLRYKSTAKTLLRKLQQHVDLGAKEAAAATHRELVQLLDRAAARKAIHRNTVARKKARAARILLRDPLPETKQTRRPKKSTAKRPVNAAKATTKAKSKAATDTATDKAAATGTATAATEAKTAPAAKKPAAKTAAKKPAAKKTAAGTATAAKPAAAKTANAEKTAAKPAAKADKDDAATKNDEPAKSDAANKDDDAATKA